LDCVSSDCEIEDYDFGFGFFEGFGAKGFDFDFGFFECFGYLAAEE